jgi:hypothetical protein
MKKLMLLAAFLVACGPREQPATDTAAMAAGPAPLTAAEVAGTWSGVAMAEGSDSVLFRFTAVIQPSGDGKAIIAGQPDSVQVTHAFDADSVIATSAPYTDQMLPGKPTVTFRAVARRSGDNLVGTSATMLASRPDSVLGRVRLEMTKSP